MKDTIYLVTGLSQQNLEYFLNEIETLSKEDRPIVTLIDAPQFEVKRITAIEIIPISIEQFLQEIIQSHYDIEAKIDDNSTRN